MKISILYDIDSDNSHLIPIWLMINSFTFDWSKTMYINIDTPFERFTFDEIDCDVLALSVPDHVYTRNRNNPSVFGLHLPSLKDYISKTLEGSGQYIDGNDIKRLMLRITDIENVMEAEIRSIIKWK